MSVSLINLIILKTWPARLPGSSLESIATDNSECSAKVPALNLVSLTGCQLLARTSPRHVLELLLSEYVAFLVNSTPRAVCGLLINSWEFEFLVIASFEVGPLDCCPPPRTGFAIHSDQFDALSSSSPSFATALRLLAGHFDDHPHATESINHQNQRKTRYSTVRASI